MSERFEGAPAPVAVLPRIGGRDAAGSSSVALVEARLGRPAQDMLEAAVVLEAWGGVPAQRALDMGASLVSRAASVPEPSTAVLPPVGRRQELVIEGLAFVVSVLSIALWTQPLADALGASTVSRALTVALPLALALQWGLRRRYLSRPRGLAELARARAGLALGTVAIALGPWLVFGRAGAVAGLLTLTWTGSTILMARGWSAGYAVLVVAATPAMVTGSAPLAVLAVTAAVTAAAVAVALRAPASPERLAGGSWARAFACATLGAGLGAMLVTDSSVSWSTSATPALALLPSALAGVWAGHRVWHLDHAIPRALAGIPVIEPPEPVIRSTRPDPEPRAARPEPSAGGASRALHAVRPEPASIDPEPHVPAVTAAPRRGVVLAPVGVLLGAIGRLIGLAAVGSIVVATILPVGSGLLAAFALLALATLLVSLLEAMGRTGWAALGITCALAAELAVGHAPFAGAGLAAGAAVGVLVLLPAAVAPLLRPARTLATTLWIT
jgi:hypothetical protein